MIQFKQFLSEAVSDDLPYLETVFGSDSRDKEDSEKKEPKQPKKEPEEKVNNQITFNGLGEQTVSNHFHGQIDQYSKEHEDKIHEENSPKDKTHAKHLNSYSRGSKQLNMALRAKYAEGKKIPSHVREKLKNLDSVLDKSKLKSEMHVYTGLRDSPEKHFEGLKPGESARVHLPSYTSTTTNFEITKQFAGYSDRKNRVGTKHEPRNTDHEAEGKKEQHILKLHLDKGAKAVSVKKNSHFKAENEVLLHRGYDIQIHPNPSVHGGTHVWHAVLVKRNHVKAKELVND